MKRKPRRRRNIDARQGDKLKETVEEDKFGNINGNLKIDIDKCRILRVVHPLSKASKLGFLFTT